MGELLLSRRFGVGKSLFSRYFIALIGVQIEIQPGCNGAKNRFGGLKKDALVLGMEKKRIHWELSMILKSHKYP